MQPGIVIGLLYRPLKFAPIGGLEAVRNGADLLWHDEEIFATWLGVDSETGVANGHLICRFDMHPLTRQELLLIDKSAMHRRSDVLDYVDALLIHADSCA